MLRSPSNCLYRASHRIRNSEESSQWAWRKGAGGHLLVWDCIVVVYGLLCSTGPLRPRLITITSLGWIKRPDKHISIRCPHVQYHTSGLLFVEMISKRLPCTMLRSPSNCLYRASHRIGNSGESSQRAWRKGAGRAHLLVCIVVVCSLLCSRSPRNVPGSKKITRSLLEGPDALDRVLRVSHRPRVRA